MTALAMMIGMVPDGDWTGRRRRAERALGRAVIGGFCLPP